MVTIIVSDNLIKYLCLRKNIENKINILVIKYEGFRIIKVKCLELLNMKVLSVFRVWYLKGFSKPI